MGDLRHSSNADAMLALIQMISCSGCTHDQVPNADGMYADQGLPHSRSINHNSRMPTPAQAQALTPTPILVLVPSPGARQHCQDVVEVNCPC